MFFLLPLYALILKVFFRKKLYINHVVHGLHIHSFVFIVMTLYWILAMVWKPATDVVEPWIFLTLLAYIVISFRNTYHIKFVTSFFKVAFSGFLYTIVLTVGMLLEVVISLFFYWICHHTTKESKTLRQNLRNIVEKHWPTHCFEVSHLLGLWYVGFSTFRKAIHTG